MAGKYGSPDIIFFVDGYNMVSNKLQAVTAKVSGLSEVTTGIGEEWEEQSLTGLRRAELSQEGAFFDTVANRIHDAMSDKVSSSPQQTFRIISIGFHKDQIGALMLGYAGTIQVSYEVLGANGALTRANAEYLISGALEDAVILHPLGEETGDADTDLTPADHADQEGIRTIPITSSSVASPSVITTDVPHGLASGDGIAIVGHSGSTPSINDDDTGYIATVLTPTTFSIPENVTVGGTGGYLVRTLTQNGGYAYLQVTDLTLGGYTSVTIAVRDSADDVTYAELFTLTVVTTSPVALRENVAGDVERYLSQSVTWNGAGSSNDITYHLGFARS